MGWNNKRAVGRRQGGIFDKTIQTGFGRFALSQANAIVAQLARLAELMLGFSEAGRALPVKLKFKLFIYCRCSSAGRALPW